MLNRIKQIYFIFNTFQWNLYTTIYILFNHRNKKIWLFGAWMGEKFADNSRFLFQYIHKNKKLYGIEDVIWVSRNEDVITMLKSYGYHAILMGTLESRCAHLRAGVHVICNSDGNNGSKGDIETKFSLGAKKIQLWHGVGIKASGRLKNGHSASKIKDYMHDNINAWFATPGHWRRCYFLTTGEESKRVIMADNNIKCNKIILGIYPRLCNCPLLTVQEKSVIDMIVDYKKNGMKIVLYLPTFRNGNRRYTEPTEIETFNDFVAENNIIWIQKRHTVDNKHKDVYNMNFIITLKKEFDINLIYPYIDLLVTDYSSASSDAMYWHKPTLEYCPDFKEYRDSDRGFVASFDKYHIGYPIQNPCEIKNAILDRLFQGEKYEQDIERIRKFLFEDQNPDYNCLMENILQKIF